MKHLFQFQDILKCLAIFTITISSLPLQGQCPSVLPPNLCNMGPTFNIHATHQLAGVQNLVNEFATKNSLKKDGVNNVMLKSIGTVDVNPFTGNDIRHVQSNFDIKFIYEKLGTSRKVTVPLSVKLYCKEQSDGSKTLANESSFLEPKISDGGLLTGFFDALGFIFQASFSDYVESEIDEQLNNLGGLSGDNQNPCSCIDYNRTTQNIEVSKYEINLPPISTEGSIVTIDYVSAERLSDVLDTQGPLRPRFEYWINNRAVHNPWLDGKAIYAKSEKLDLTIVPIEHTFTFQKPTDLLQVVVHSSQGNGCLEIPVKDLSKGQNIEVIIRSETIISNDNRKVRTDDSGPLGGRYYVDYDLYKIVFSVKEIYAIGERTFPGLGTSPNVIRKKRIN